jgi:membrane-associated PAP2 superfamily phosphatase
MCVLSLDYTAYRCPWIIYLFGGLGVYVLITATVGILSGCFASCGYASTGSGAYRFLLFFMTALTGAGVASLCFDKAWQVDLDKELPADSTGQSPVPDACYYC